MAELSASADKFEAWESEEPAKPKRPPAGRVPAGVARLGMPGGSARITGYKGKVQRQSSVGPLGLGREIEASEPPEESGELDKCQEVRAEMDSVEAEIARNGGINCGWDDADHKDFLRLRTKHNNKTVTVAFITAVNRAVPTADEIAVREHVRAYERYQDLTKKKKELIV